MAGMANNDGKERKVIGLNAGYIAILIVTSIAVLCICGWKRELAGDLSGKALFWFLCAWGIASVVSIPIGAFASLRLSELVCGAVAVYALQAENVPRQRTILVFTSFILACWCGLMAYAHRWSSLPYLRPNLDVDFGAALLTSMLLRTPLQQFAAIWIGTISGDLLEQGMLGFSQVRLGTPASMDVLWSSFLLTRAFSLMAEWTAYGWGRFVSRNK